MLRLDRSVFDAICSHATREYPLEMCGLIAGPPGTDKAVMFAPCRNDDRSGTVYTVNPLDFMAAEDAADRAGWEISGVVHSHTHTEAYPSETDVRRAPVAGWHYVIVGLRRGTPQVRSFRIVDGEITEESVQVVAAPAE